MENIENYKRVEIRLEVSDTAGVLRRITGEVNRVPEANMREIHSVTRKDDKTKADMTIVLEGPGAGKADFIVRRLSKLYDVFKIEKIG
ncbi:MAG: hypothetical protein LBN42_02060 [Oscillospiraceae bacterium]|jgi:acetolactate synthase small subunit|nr:hypothetical protein [Oscillospiraceae bacterium]